MKFIRKKVHCQSLSFIVKNSIFSFITFFGNAHHFSKVIIIITFVLFVTFTLLLPYINDIVTLWYYQFDDSFLKIDFTFFTFRFLNTNLYEIKYFFTWGKNKVKMLLFTLTKSTTKSNLLFEVNFIFAIKKQL